MRTSVDIPDALYRELKSKAAREKRSVKELILRGVEVELRPRSKKAHAARHFPACSLKEARHARHRQCQDLRDHFFSLISTSGSLSLISAISTIRPHAVGSSGSRTIHTSVFAASPSSDYCGY